MTDQDSSLLEVSMDSNTNYAKCNNHVTGNKGGEWTDLRRWRLHAEKGRHTWKYIDNPEELSKSPHQTFRERYWLGLENGGIPELQHLGQHSDKPQSEQLPEVLRKGSNFLRELQMEDGSWGSNCDGPVFVTPGIVFACYIVGVPIPLPFRQELCRYLVNTCNDDGGWGLYITGPSTVIGTALNYVMLRVLGLETSHPTCKKACDLLASMGGVLGIPSWGRFFLCIMNLYNWDGILPFPSELTLTPRWFQGNPANWWMPIRNLFMGMSYLYGHRFQAPEDDLIKAIRNELYPQQAYSDIKDWTALRSYVNDIDLLKPKSLLQSAMVSSMGHWEQFTKLPLIRTLRRRGLEEVLFQVQADVHTTEYCSYSPGYWPVDIVVLQHAYGRDSQWVQCMAPHFADGLWMCREGLAASGTDGNAVWETSFTMQAICSVIQVTNGGNATPAELDAIDAGLEFLVDSQLLHDPIEMHRTNRHPTKGGWPYSTKMQGYFASDATAETVLAILQSYKISSVSPKIPVERLQLAVDSLIGMESCGSGFGAYENVRGSELLELCNITDAFENIMTEHRYAETTASVMKALSEFTAEHPGYRRDDIDRCLKGGAVFLLQSQFEHGGWIGTWGICFSFATMWALQGLACVGHTEQNSPAVAKACAFLLRHQNSEDGGWGEALESYMARDYVHEPKGSQVPNTAYAVIGLLAARCTNRTAIERGVNYLIKTQQKEGDWLPGTPEAICAPPCGYRYPLYKFHFSLKAIAGYIKRYGNKPLSSSKVRLEKLD
ncbi:squalene-hopene-cyclase [Xylaria bambusicola]|uniref:squalene-hopene-cyclase n=1 Tax=Xylaria bambusicola TaxID=326684 RepID=UPI00200881A3|nr:squalene-hopene-cyclase [Xylaria bambusicola]KAI0506202.1 squalene-hopene-cyclase [Xylaria bambusicola]